MHIKEYDYKEFNDITKVNDVVIEILSDKIINERNLEYISIYLKNVKNLGDSLYDISLEILMDEILGKGENALEAAFIYKGFVSSSDGQSFIIKRDKKS